MLTYLTRYPCTWLIPLPVPCLEGEGLCNRRLLGFLRASPFGTASLSPPLARTALHAEMAPKGHPVMRIWHLKVTLSCGFGT